MFDKRVCLTLAVIAASMVANEAGAAPPTFKCDAPDATEDVGWSLVPSLETVGKSDSPPYQDSGGDWFVNRTTTLLPFCNYYDEIGIYSMRSYTLSRRTETEKVAVCRREAGGNSVTVPPYAGLCPPE